MAMLQDDSTDEVTCCYLQLQERLRINQGDCNKRGMSAKDFKQFCNNKKKHFPDEQSSSSSSLDMYNDPAMPGPSSASAYGLQNKKRQNGDKRNGQLVNSKRTCLDDKFPRSPSFLDYRKVKKNGDISHSRRNMDLTTEPISSSRNLLPGYTYEEHKDDSSECSDVIPWPETAKTIKNNTQPKHSGMFEVLLPGPQSVQCLDSTSEEDTRTRQMGALKGGRQSPDPSSNKSALRRKIRRVLDSDDSDSEDWPAGYRARPLIFSSSDSDDSRIGKKLENKVSGVVSKKSDNPSYPTIDSQTFQGQDLNAFRDRPPQRRSLLNLDSLVDIAATPNCSSGPAISPSFKLFKSRSKAPRNFTGKASRRDFGLGEGTSNLPCQKTLLNPLDKTEMQARLSGDVQEDTDERNIASSSRLPTGPLSFRQLGTKGRSAHPVGDISKDAPHTSNSSRRRALGRTRSLRQGSSLALAFPNTFDHEDDQDSSELEFFTANSYSDNESNTESLGRRMGRHNFPEMRSNPSINVGSSEDEISVVYSSGPPDRSHRSRTGETRRRASRTLGRRYNRRSRRILPQRPGVSLSPDPVEQVRQVEEDERFARVLQAQFDAEVDPPYIPRPHSSPNPCLMNIREASSSDTDLDAEERMMEMATRELPLQYRTAALYNNLVPPRGYHAQRLAAPFVFPRTSRVNAHWTSHLHHPMLDHITFNEDSFEALLGLAELNGDVTRGLQKSQINRLPTRKFAVLTSASSSSAADLPHKRAELNKECQVCLNDYVNGDVLRILPCFHEFHTPCIDPWLKINHTCPVCRVVVDLDE